MSRIDSVLNEAQKPFRVIRSGNTPLSVPGGPLRGCGGLIKDMNSHC